MPHRVDGVTPTGNISIWDKQWVGGMAVTPEFVRLRTKTTEEDGE
jgi:hypothetical protein